MRIGPTNIPKQLNLLFADSLQRSWTVIVGGSQKKQISLEIQLHDWGAYAKLFGPYPNPIGEPRRALLWEFEFRVRPPVVMRSSHPFAIPSWFKPAAWRGNSLHAVFKTALNCAIRSSRFKKATKFDFRPTDEGDSGLVIARSETKSAERCRKKAKRRAKERIQFEPMRHALLEVQSHVLQKIVPTASRAAGRFVANSPVSLMVYQMVADDLTGRIEQISVSCPGVLLMMSLLKRQSTSHVHEIQQMIVSGVRLPKIIARVVELWGRSFYSSQTAKALSNQRLRIRRATPGVFPDHIWEPLPGKLVPEDIPRMSRDNRNWFLVTYAAKKAMDDYSSGEIPENAIAWASRFASEVSTIWGRSLVTLSWQFRWLADYLLSEQRIPGRKTLPQSLIDDCAEWHGNHEWNQKQLPLNEKMNPGLTVGFSMWKTRYGCIRFLGMAGDVYEEGKLMDHCIGSHAESARDGKIQIFHGDFEGEGATIEISCFGWYPRVIEARGVANSSLSSRAMRGIGRWLDDLGSHIAKQCLASSNGHHVSLIGP